MIAASKMKLEPHEVQIDPRLSGLAHVVKKIGEYQYSAWVNATNILSQEETQYLPCFPAYQPEPHDQTQKVNILINDFTNWRVPSEDFNTIEWLGESHPAWTGFEQGDENLNPVVDEVKRMFADQIPDEFPNTPPRSPSPSQSQQTP